MEYVLEKLTMLHDPEFVKVIEKFKEQRISDPMISFFRASEDFVNCESIHRRAERAELLKMPKAEYYEEMAMLHNKQGLRKLGHAQRLMSEAIEKFPHDLEKAASTKETMESLDEQGKVFKNQLFEQDFPVETTEEIWTGYEEARRIVATMGVKDLMKHADSKMRELLEARTDLTIGRRHASPWIWKAIAYAILGIFIIVVCVLCFNVSNCTECGHIVVAGLQWAAVMWKFC